MEHNQIEIEKERERLIAGFGNWGFGVYCRSVVWFLILGLKGFQFSIVLGLFLCQELEIGKFK